ncbi:hypothetical protein GWI33_015572 [Rhynchophorus ferrugineus]|uniref:Uncharacterized protein n=1 Tax=Rhynchophorus ferrugineus TaxID=354439 RepID=A0A834M5W7_RHYFE|nr:hypothetical protein GWI33_015572 [Rhynchophorus ferrugineus]
MNKHHIWNISYYRFTTIITITYITFSNGLKYGCRFFQLEVEFLNVEQYNTGCKRGNNCETAPSCSTLHVNDNDPIRSGPLLFSNYLILRLFQDFCQFQGSLDAAVEIDGALTGTAAREIPRRAVRNSRGEN